jgi:Tol biopolymer transport system component
MPENATILDKLETWKEIASHLGTGERTAMRWEETRGLPIHRLPGLQRSHVFAYRSELDLWVAKDNPEEKDEMESSELDGPPPSPIEKPVQPQNATIVPPLANTPSVPPEPVRSSVPHWKRALFSAVGFVAAVLMMAAGFKFFDANHSSYSMEFRRHQQLTANGLEKRGLQTDGKNLYFGQESNGWMALAEMPVEGGTIRILWSPQASVQPVDLSPDRKRLLALTFLGDEKEKELWIVPLDKGEAHRLSTVRTCSAAWSPDGKTIAFATGKKISLISEDGSSLRDIASFTSVPSGLHWSPDGSRLRFLLLDATFKPSYWELESSDGMRTTLMRSLPSSLEWQESPWTRAGKRDAYFATAHTESGGHYLEDESLNLVQHGTHWWEPVLQIVKVPLGLSVNDGVAFDSETSRLYVLNGSPYRSSFLRFDRNTQNFHSILPDIDGVFLDYSRDGNWIAYVSQPLNIIEVSHADGSAARSLTGGDEPVELPRWSPDGKQLAFMSKVGDHPWRIYIVSLATGERREAAEGNDNQGAPTWSPDGRYIAYGNLLCERASSCAIHRIDLSTGKVRTLPGSEGLYTARWSPDGRYIAALRMEPHQLYLFDVRTEHWRKLADSMNGSDMNWSPDSKYIYINVPGNHASIVRIQPSKGSPETVLDLRAIGRQNVAENLDMGFSVAPDGSLILNHPIHTSEIYAYDIKEW